MLPPRPARALPPVDNVTEPALPNVAVPVDILISPVPPDALAFGVASAINPLDVSLLYPLEAVPWPDEAATYI